MNFYDFTTVLYGLLLSHDLRRHSKVFNIVPVVRDPDRTRISRTKDKAANAVEIVASITSKLNTWTVTS